VNRNAPSRNGPLQSKRAERRGDSESIAFVVRYRCDMPPTDAGTPRCQTEIEDINAGDKRHFIEFNDGVAHLRARVEAFSRRAWVMPGPPTEPE
jgi:hypothetical protein